MAGLHDSAPRPRAEPLPADPEELAALVEDGRRWRRWWDRDMCAMRAEQVESEVAERVHAALLLRDGATTPEQADILKQASVAISESGPRDANGHLRWGGSISHQELLNRRSLAPNGPAHRILMRPIDREALARWVATGRSEVPAAAPSPEPGRAA
jgi:hypothetical protein